MTRRILLAEIMHESNTFNEIATTKADFAGRYWLEGAEIATSLAGTNTEVWGVLEAGKRLGWEITHPFAASASPSALSRTDRSVDLHDVREPVQWATTGDALRDGAHA